MFQQKKMKAISSFAFKGLAGGIAALYLVLFSLSFWNIHSYNKKLKNYPKVIKAHKEKSAELKPLSNIELAKQLKISPSTVSRILRSKYIQTPKGALSMKSLLASSVSKNRKVTPLQSFF